MGLGKVNGTDRDGFKKISERYPYLKLSVLNNP